MNNEMIDARMYEELDKKIEEVNEATDRKLNHDFDIYKSGVIAGGLSVFLGFLMGTVYVCIINKHRK